MDTGNLPFYFQEYRILSILLPGIWDTECNILVIFRDIDCLGKFCQFIRDNCLFTSRDMGYLVPPIQASYSHMSVLAMQEKSTKKKTPYAQKVRSRGGPTLFSSFFSCRREDPDTTLSGPSSARQRNAIYMAFRWRAHDIPTIIASSVSL